MKKRILWHSDAPTCVTGFGNVARNLIPQIYDKDKHELTVLGINHGGEPYDQDEYPYLKPDKNSPLVGMWPAAIQGDIYGVTKVVQFAKEGNYDVVFIMNDLAIMAAILPKLLEVREGLTKKFKIVFYFPVDCYPKKSWIDEVVAKVDFPVTYTEYAHREIAAIDAKLDVPFIYHGSDVNLFHPLGTGERKVRRKMIFPNLPDDCFIVMNVNRNQPRKDINRTFAAFALFKKKVPNSFLYIHAAVNDVGGNLEDLGDFYGLEPGKDFSYPDPRIFSTSKGIPIELMPQIYASADLVVSSTLGEGWGLSITEAMACGVPVLFPHNTSLVEIIGENQERGTFIQCGGTDNTIALGMQDQGRVRPMVDVKDMADKMLNIYCYRDKYQRRAEAALTWSLENTWDHAGAQWRKVFEEALKDGTDDAKQP